MEGPATLSRILRRRRRPPPGRSRLFGTLPTILALTFAWPGSSPVAAQEDFRSLDVGRPLRTTDAYPKKFLEWELQAGARGQWSERGRRGIAPLALEVGLFPNLEAGVEMEPGYEDLQGGEAAWGLEGVSLHALYNFNQESWTWPAVALQLAVESPVGGGLARNAWGAGGRVVATRSFASRMRVHGNAGYAFQDVADGGDFWIGGLASDLPLGLSSRLVMADLFVEVPVAGGATRTWAEAGARFQVSNRTVVDVGLSTRLDEWVNERANVELTVGLSRTFGIRGLSPAPEYPDPSIR